MSRREGIYKYHSDVEWEAMWIEEHSRHLVDAGSGNWLVCRTCGSVLHVTTQPSLVVLKALRA